MEKILIIGGVAAGATAAARARRLSGDAEITMLEAGPDVSFANCGLPYYIGGDIKSRSKLILQSPESFRDQYNVTVHIETSAVRIDREAKKVTAVHTPSGKETVFEYDKLILGQGGKPIIPPFPGIDSGRAFSLWTLEDMDRIHNFIEDESPRSAVVVGGGFIGLEMAEALTKRGLKVRIVEKMPQIMPLMDPETAGFLTEELEAFGVEVYTNKGVTAIGEGNVSLDDGSTLDADMVLLSVGVRPTLKLAEEAGLKLGEARGLLVDEYLQTSDANIYAAGDMVEIQHRVNGRKVRIPLAGPANRQGRIAASNALGQKRSYSGSVGTSVVRVFEAVAGTTGLNLKQARDAGFDAEAVTVHKEHHTGYYPGSVPVSVLVVYDKADGRILGGQTAGYKGADKRLDVLATATAGGMTISDMAELDLSYSPPIGTANDAINMAAYTAENRQSGYSPSLTAAEIDAFAGAEKPAFIDLRDYFAFEKSHVTGAENIPLEQLAKSLNELPKDRAIAVYDDTGKKGHQALRRLNQLGFSNVVNVSGGFTSLERHARTAGFEHLHVPVLPAEAKSLHGHKGESGTEEAAAEAEQSNDPLAGTGPIVIDVRTPEEFEYGAFPGAVNIPLDELGYHTDKLGPKDREIVVYCASGARSAYAARMLGQQGFTNVSNGGGLMNMMATLGR